MSAPVSAPAALGPRIESTALELAPRRAGLLRPLAPPADVLAAQNDTRAMVAAALEQGRDYGTIPGTAKPTLFKPGAERLALAFGLAPRFRVVESEIDHDRPVHWIKRGKKGSTYEGDSVGLYRYVVVCEMVHRESGTVIASCIASCSSMEAKYVDRPRDVENTIVKMAEKRALVGATLLALGLSDEFTQDVEDLAANNALGGDSGNARAPSRDDAPSARDYTVCPAGPHAGKPWSDADVFTGAELRRLREYFLSDAGRGGVAEDVCAGYAQAISGEIGRRLDAYATGEGRLSLGDTETPSPSADAIRDGGL